MLLKAYRHKAWSHSSRSHVNCSCFPLIFSVFHFCLFLCHTFVCFVLIAFYFSFLVPRKIVEFLFISVLWKISLKYANWKMCMYMYACIYYVLFAFAWFPFPLRYFLFLSFFSSLCPTRPFFALFSDWDATLHKRNGHVRSACQSRSHSMIKNECRIQLLHRLYCSLTLLLLQCPCRPTQFAMQHCEQVKRQNLFCCLLLSASLLVSPFCSSHQSPNTNFYRKMQIFSRRHRIRKQFYLFFIYLFLHYE